MDALLVGRRTWEVVSRFETWPYSGKRVFVLTRRPADGRHGERFLSGTPAEVLSRLAEAGVGRVYVDGGRVVSQFVAAGLLDELTISVLPVIIGTGIRLGTSSRCPRALLALRGYTRRHPHPGSSMAYLPNAEKIARAFEGATLLDEGKPVRFSVVDVGPLIVTSGALAASDPLVSPSPEAFAREISNGRHPVRLAVATFENGDERVAFAEVLLAGRPVARWEPAVQPKDGEPLADGEYLGYGVDAGTGCFMDPAAGRLLDARMEADERYYETILEELERTSRPTWSWASIRPAPDREENVVCFSSGWGDGVYPSFLGFATDGSLAAVLTDFLVLIDDLPQDSTDVGPVRAPGLPAPAPPAKRPWWKFWSRVGG